MENEGGKPLGGSRYLDSRSEKAAHGDGAAHL